MILLNDGPFQVGWKVGKVHYPSFSVTFVVKGTFDLTPGGPVKPAAKPAPLAGDLYEGDDPKKPLRYPSDFAEFKPLADLLVVGHAYAPGGGSADVLRVSFQVGRFSKMLAVIGDRVWRRGFLGNTMGSIQPFKQMPLSYARSFGGEGFKKNPAGRGHAEEAGPDGKPVIRLPNLENPARLIVSPSDAPDPAGFGPLSLTWPQRMSKTGSYKGKWLKERFPWFPEDFDWNFFNAAPPDQQVPFLHGDEKIRFENLHPRHPVFEASLPGLRPRCFYARVVGSPLETREVPLNLDTLWADLDDEKLVLVWRGVLDVPSDVLPKDDHVWVVSEPVAEPLLPLSRYEGPLADRVVGRVSTAPAVPATAAGTGTPVVGAPAEQVREEEPSVPALPPEPAGPTRQECADRAARREKFDGEDLTGADFSDLDLSGLSFKGAVLAESRFRRARLEGADFTNAVLTDADLSRADLRKALLDRADFTGARLAHSDLREASLEGTVFLRATLKEANLSQSHGAGVVFQQANLRRADLRRAALAGANLAGAVLHEADATEAVLDGASIEKASGLGWIAERASLKGLKAAEAALWGARLREAQAADSVWQAAELMDADFREANLDRAEMSDADLRRARFSMCSLKHAKLGGARLSGATAMGANLLGAALPKADLTGADLSGSNLFSADLLDAELRKTILDGADVRRTVLSFK